MMNSFQQFINAKKEILNNEKKRLELECNQQEHIENQSSNENANHRNVNINEILNNEILGNVRSITNTIETNKKKEIFTNKYLVSEDFNNLDNLEIWELPQVHSKNLNKCELNLKGSTNYGNKNERTSQGKIIENNKQNNWTRREKNDDMEQWISDTFYSYFPSLNSEQIKYENENYTGRLDYQTYLNKISNEDDKEFNKNNNAAHIIEQNVNNVPKTHSSDKSEMEIIVTTNPNYESLPKYRYNHFVARPSSTRDKLLQDLKHTELSNMIYGDAIEIRKQIEIEREMSKKKEYQKDLIRQIEDKRREIELLKEKERMEEETLTRKLEEQLKSVKLQEELEKEKVKSERTRFDIERNKILREQIISKLENDTIQIKLLERNSRETKSENDKDSLVKSTNRDQNKNEVYRFFTKSACRDYRKPLHEQSNTDTFEEFARTSVENKEFFFEKKYCNSLEKRNLSPFLSKNCRHINSKICPFCEIKLKNYESCCPHCKLQILDDGAENRTMLCESCENEYLICSACDKKKKHCEFCYHKCNVCVKCVRNYCVNCKSSINFLKNKTIKTKSCNNNYNKDRKNKSEHSFQILELPHIENNDIPINNCKKSGISFKSEKLDKISTNYTKNSKFSQNNNLNLSFFEFGVRNGEVLINSKIYNSKNRLLNQKMSNNCVNKLEIECNRSCKAKANLYNRNISVNEMSLLSEMPKNLNLKMEPRKCNETRDNKGLSKKWKIPAIEKRIMSTSSPIVLTQLGAVRRKLQVDRLQAEFL